jgi:hypothetical protein
MKQVRWRIGEGQAPFHASEDMPRRATTEMPMPYGDDAAALCCEIGKQRDQSVHQIVDHGIQDDAAFLGAG